MPHFIIECSNDILDQIQPEIILQTVYETAESTGLFAENDIKVRINPYRYFKLGDIHSSFLHVFGNIMEGRTTEQKANLSESIIRNINQLLPDLSILSINIREFERATYFNKSMIK